MSNNETNQGSDIVLGREMSGVRRGLAFFSIAMIYFFYCFNFSIGTFVKPTMIASVADGGFGFTLAQTEQIFASMSFGTIPGTFLFGMMSAKVGKKRTLITVALLIAATTLLPLMAPANFTLWLVARCASGFVLGAVFGTSMPLIADMFPTKYRGKLAATLTALFSLAMIFSGKVYGLLGDANWRVMMWIAIIAPAVGAVLAFFFVPDDHQMTVELNQAQEGGEKISYLSMYKGKYLWIGLGTILLSGCNFTAYSAFSNNSTLYLTSTLMLSEATAGSIYSMLGIGQLLGYFAWGSIADKFGRKFPLVGMGLSAVSVYVFSTLSADSVTALKLISMTIGFMVGYSGAWGAYYTELFPDKFRALSAGMSFNGGRIVATICLPLIAATASGSLGMTSIFYLSAAVFVVGTVIWALLPETLRKKQK